MNFFNLSELVPRGLEVVLDHRLIVVDDVMGPRPQLVGKKVTLGKLDRPVFEDLSSLVVE